MIRKVQTGILLALSAGVAGAIACGGGSDSQQSPTQVFDASVTVPVFDGGDASTQCSLLQITDCSTGQVVAIAEALNQAAIDEANTALAISSNNDVRTFATRVVSDHNKIAQLLAAWVAAAGIQPLPSDISQDITANATNQINVLEQSRRFDRDFAAREVSDTLSFLGFLEHVLLARDPLDPDASPPDARPGSNAALALLLAETRIVVEGHLQLAFALEQRLVGFCGTGPNDAGVDAPAPQPTTQPTTQPPPNQVPDAAAEAATTPVPTPVPVPTPTVDAGEDARVDADAAFTVCDDSGVAPDGAPCEAGSPILP